MASGLGRPLLPSLLDRVTCSVCMHQYDNNSHVPKLLPCQHTFCQSCVATVAKKGEQEEQDPEVECPICRQRYPVPADGFSTNRDLLDIAHELQEASSSMMLCDSHDGMECALFCMDCLQALCVRCLKGKQHITHQLEEVPDAKRLLRERYDNRIKEEQAAVERKVAEINTSSYSTAEVKKAETDVKKIVEDCEDMIKKWNEDRLRNIDGLVQTAIARDDAIDFTRAKLQSLLEQPDIDMVTMIAKLNDQHSAEDEISKLCEKYTMTFKFDQRKETLENDLKSILLQNTTSKLLQIKPPPMIVPTLFEFRKAVDGEGGLICEIDDDIVFYEFRTGKIQIYDSETESYNQRLFRNHLRNWTPIHTLPQYRKHIDSMKKQYVSRFCNNVSYHWDKAFI